MDSVRTVVDWPVGQAAVAVVNGDGKVLDSYGPQDREFPLASVTKLLTAYAILIAVEEGALDWDDPAGPPGSTVRHLLAHASGMAFDEDKAVAAPGTRRLYSNAGYATLANTLAEAAGIPFPDYLREAVFEPLGMKSSRLVGPAGSGAVSTCADLVAFATELQSPNLIATATFTLATRVAFAGLSGVLPGLGHQRPNDWGLGFELRDHKSPHWTGVRSSPDTYGHFGQSGTFLWVDPAARVACVALTDREFGDWAKIAWPAFTDAVLTELARP